MERDNPVNIKEIVNVRFQNPKFVYDGKRVQPVYDRRSFDYSSGLIYQCHLPLLNPPMHPSLNTSSQALTLRSPETCSVHESVTSKFVHMSINKIRSPVNSVLWNHDGRRLLTGSSSGEITMWNGFSFNFDTILQAHESSIRSMCWSHSSSFLITSDSTGTIKYWNPSMNNIQVIEAHPEGIKDLSFCYNDSKFCSASDDSTIKIWDSVRAQCESTLTGHNWDVRKAQWHPKQALIASGGKDNLLKLWDPREGKCLTTLHYHKNTILSMRFYQDGYLLSGGKDQVVKMLDLRTMRECFTYKSPGTEVTALVVHPFSGLFVTGCNEGTVQFWDSWVAEPIATSDNRHDNTIWSLDFHPAGHVLATGSADSMIKFWIRPRTTDALTTGPEEPLAEAPQYAAEESLAIPGL